MNKLITYFVALFTFYSCSTTLPRSNKTYLALGDSYTIGESVVPFAKNKDKKKIAAQLKEYNSLCKLFCE